MCPLVLLSRYLLSFTLLVTDECELGIDTCDPNAECVDLTEGFDCVCNPGFTGDGVLCLSKRFVHYFVLVYK